MSSRQLPTSLLKLDFHLMARVRIHLIIVKQLKLNDDLPPLYKWVERNVNNNVSRRLLRATFSIKILQTM